MTPARRGAVIGFGVSVAIAVIFFLAGAGPCFQDCGYNGLWGFVHGVPLIVLIELLAGGGFIGALTGKLAEEWTTPPERR